MTVWQRPFKILLTLMVAVGLAAFASGCGDSSNDFQEGGQPNISADKASLSFSVTGLGETQSQLLTISNTGSATLNVNSMTVEGQGSSRFALFVADDTGNPVEYGGSRIDVLTSEAAESEDGRNSFEIRVDYTPTDVGGASSELVIRSNDPDNQELRIDLNALEVGPQPQADPNPIVFGQVQGGEVVTQDVTITNVGSAPMQVEDLVLSGSADFELVLGDGLPSGPVQPAESFQVRVTYAPPTQGPDLGSLTLSYLFDVTDPNSTREYPIEISANGAEPCIRVTPSETIDFGQAVIGRVAEMDVTVENCGSENLVISSIALGAASDDKFALESLPSEITNGNDLILARGSARQFKVTYAPEDESSSSGTLVINSNDPARPELVLDVFGTGTFNNCPEAVATARIRDSGDPWDTQLVAENTDYIQFDASESSDPDGDRIAEYQWSVVRAPTGFSIGFAPNARAEKPEIQVANVGDYEFELNVIDENGLAACEPARITVRAKSDKSLIIELQWRTPSDLDETDTGMGAGTDLDLHMIRAGGFWEDKFGDSDVYFSNTEANWGAEGSEDDNAVLDRDDTDGGGPETISIRTPAPTDGSAGANGYSAPYTVGVYFYDDWDFAPPVLATVRIFFNGEEMPSVVMPDVPDGQEAAKEFQVADPSPARQGDFWLVGEIDWAAAGGSFTAIDTIMTGYPQ